MTRLLWVTVPYLAFTSLLFGHLWRYRHDQFGWTTRSSQLYERRLLRWGSPLFHFGLLGVLGGHVLGIAIPASWTAAAGVSEHAYHLLSVTLGTFCGLATLAGLGILLYRRSIVPAVRRATTTIDKMMYLLLSAALGTGMLNTTGSNLIGGGYNYRATVSPWFRSLFTLHPHPELMATTPVSFQIHNLVVLTLLALWPYTRLVHVFSAPLGYLTRPYIVYRSRDVHHGDARRYARAWESPPYHPQQIGTSLGGGDWLCSPGSARFWRGSRQPSRPQVRDRRRHRRLRWPGAARRHGGPARVERN